jgi:hypothetical protein
MSSGVGLMARAKKTPKKMPAPDRVATAIIHLKGSKAMADWLEQAHRTTRYPKTTILRMALGLWAERNKLDPPPEF